MAITIQCPTCGKEGQAPDGAAGRKGKCRGCKATILIPGRKDGGGSARADKGLRITVIPGTSDFQAVAESRIEVVRHVRATFAKIGKFIDVDHQDKFRGRVSCEPMAVYVTATILPAGMHRWKIATVVCESDESGDPSRQGSMTFANALVGETAVAGHVPKVEGSNPGTRVAFRAALAGVKMTAVWLILLVVCSPVLVGFVVIINRAVVSVQHPASLSADTPTEAPAPTGPPISFEEFDAKLGSLSKLSSLQKEELFKQWSGRSVLWRGVVADVDADRICIKHKVSTLTYDVDVWIAASGQKELKSVNVGDAVLYSGKIASYGGMLPHGVKEGRVVTRGALTPESRLLTLANTEKRVLSLIQDEQKPAP